LLEPNHIGPTMVKSKVEIKLFMMTCLKKRLNVILIDIQIL